MIKREEYLSWLIKLKDKQIIKVITGIRRCGKSTLFAIYKNYLIENGVQINQIIDINFESNENRHLLDQQKLHDYIINTSVKDKKNYIFLDEIQNVSNFEKCINSLNLNDNLDIYIYNRIKLLYIIRRACNLPYWKIYANSYVAFIF